MPKRKTSFDIYIPPDPQARHREKRGNGFTIRFRDPRVDGGVFTRARRLNYEIDHHKIASDEPWWVLSGQQLQRRDIASNPKCVRSKLRRTLSHAEITNLPTPELADFELLQADPKKRFQLAVMNLPPVAYNEAILRPPQHRAPSSSELEEIFVQARKRLSRPRVETYLLIKSQANGSLINVLEENPLLVFDELLVSNTWLSIRTKNLGSDEFGAHNPEHWKAKDLAKLPTPPDFHFYENYFHRKSGKANREFVRPRSLVRIVRSTDTLETLEEFISACRRMNFAFSLH